MATTTPRVGTTVRITQGRFAHCDGLLTNLEGSRAEIRVQMEPGGAHQYVVINVAFVQAVRS